MDCSHYAVLPNLLFHRVQLWFNREIHQDYLQLELVHVFEEYAWLLALGECRVRLKFLLNFVLVFEKFFYVLLDFLFSLDGEWNLHLVFDVLEVAVHVFEFRAVGVNGTWLDSKHCPVSGLSKTSYVVQVAEVTQGYHVFKFVLGGPLDAFWSLVVYGLGRLVYFFFGWLWL